MTAPDPLDPHHDGSVHYTLDRGAGPRRHASTCGSGSRTAPTATPAAREVVLRWVRDGEPALRRGHPRERRRGRGVVDGADRAGQPGHVVPLRGLLRPVGLPLAQRHRRPPPRRHRRRGLPDQHRAPVARLGRPTRWATRSSPTASRAPRPGPRSPPGRSPPTGTTRSCTRAPTSPTSGTAAPSTAWPPTSTTSQTLGATLLYLTPVFEAWSTHRYDAVSFDHVDPLLGGDAALDRLIEAVHAHGLRLVGDLTTNHTGDHHDWFLRALADPTSPEHAFFRFRTDGSTTSRGWTSRACRSSTTPPSSWPAGCTTGRTRWSPAGCGTGWTAGASTWPT